MSYASNGRAPCHKSLIINNKKTSPKKSERLFDLHIWRIWLSYLADRPLESFIGASCSQDMPTIYLAVSTISIGEHYILSSSGIHSC